MYGRFEEERYGIKDETDRKKEGLLRGRTPVRFCYLIKTIIITFLALYRDAALLFLTYSSIFHPVALHRKAALFIYMPPLSSAKRFLI